MKFMYDYDYEEKGRMLKKYSHEKKMYQNEWWNFSDVF